MEVYQSYQRYYCTKPPEKINPQREKGILNYWQSKWKITVSLPLFQKKDFLPKKQGRHECIFMYDQLLQLFR